MLKYYELGDDIALARKKLNRNENNRFRFMETHYLLENPKGRTIRTLLIKIIKSLLYLSEFWSLVSLTCDMHFGSINMEGGHDTDFAKSQQFIYKSKQEN